jgi:hypothetical protein
MGAELQPFTVKRSVTKLLQGPRNWTDSLDDSATFEGHENLYLKC